jgi:SAM-dependent methyltransferase
VSAAERPYVDDSARSIDPQLDPENNYFVPVWNAVLERLPGWRAMLDVGCGNGVFAAYAKRRTGCTLRGVDGNPEVLQWARDLGHFDDLFAVRDFNTDPLPVPDGSADFALAKDLLEHLVRPDHVVAEVRRALVPGGHFLVHVPNHFPLHGRMKFLITNRLDTYDYFPGAKLWSFPHLRFFTLDSLRELMEAHGFAPIADLSWNFPVAPYLPLPAVARRALARRWPSHWAGGLTLLCEKR